MMSSEDTLINKIDIGPVNYAEGINLNAQILVCKKYKFTLL